MQGVLSALSDMCGISARVVFCASLGPSSSAMAVFSWRASPTVGKFSEIIQGCGTSLSAQEQFVSITGYIDNLVDFMGLAGIRSSSRRPKRRITFMLARQLWQPVSAMAETVMA